VISTNHIHEDSHFKSDSEGDGQPVQLYACWCDVVAGTKTKNKPCRLRFEHAVVGLLLKPAGQTESRYSSRDGRV
jgi:hypothetical protein